MASRTKESPMDFEYTAPRPTSIDSPFALATANLQRGQAAAAAAAQSPTPAPRNRDRMDIDTDEGLEKKRPHSIFQSPSKRTSTPFASNIFSTPSRGPMASNAPLPAPPAFRTPSSFTTPKPAALSFGHTADSFMSSPAEAYMSSPDLGADTEETPEVKRMVRRMATPGRSGRGEIVRRGKFTDLGPPKKVRKRKTRDGGVAWARDIGDDGSEEEDEETGSSSSGARSSSPKKKKASKYEPMLNWADKHRDIPIVLSQYLQLTLNFFIIGVAVFALIYFARAVYADVLTNIEARSQQILTQISLCQAKYIENRCAPDTRTEFAAKGCEELERCMNEGPEMVRRGRVSAETIASILNGFMDTISYKAMAFVLLAFFGSLFITNTAFAHYRAKLTEHPIPPSTPFPSTPFATPGHPLASQAAFLPPPGTPSHHASAYEHPAAWATTPRRQIGYASGVGARLGTPATGRRREWNKL